ncbi:hypothetical protein [Sporosarcina sp. FA9]|uniref:hypothetical protein n=1 Tax=Sporosarcina sp. FA9 TaxID=3413030 RepID=UPI003F65EDF0
MTIERYLIYMAFQKGIRHKLVKSLLNEWLRDANLVELKRRKLRNLSGVFEGVSVFRYLTEHKW